MQELYNNVYQIIANQLDFNDLWSNFKPYEFALYNNQKVYFKNKQVDWDNRFIANTIIEYDNKIIAIWQITNSDQEDLEILASKLVHEMFHAFQRESKDYRYPNDLLLIDYPNNLDNYIYKYQENSFLTKAFFTEDINEKLNYLNHFISCRKYRESLIGQIINQEYLAETLEGMATYIEMKALKKLSLTKYLNKVEKCINHLTTIDQNFFNIRNNLYFSGSLFCILLSDLAINFDHQLGKTDTSVFKLITTHIEPEQPIINFNTNLLTKAFENYLINKENIFTHFFKTHNQTITNDFTICGYDPMNMIKKNNQILCSNFINLKNINTNEIIFIKGPVLLNLKKDSINKVESYII